jgi:hypothetical protein
MKEPLIFANSSAKQDRLIANLRATSRPQHTIKEPDHV